MTIHDSRMCPSSVHTMRRIASRARALTNDTARATRSRDDGTRGSNGTARTVSSSSTEASETRERVVPFGEDLFARGGGQRRRTDRRGIGRMTPDEARARAERAVWAMVSSSATFAAMAWTTQRLGLVLGVGCYAPLAGGA